MKRSTKITSIIVIFFLIIAGVIIARTMIGNHFKKKFSKRPPPGIIVKTVEERKFQNIIETFFLKALCDFDGNFHLTNRGSMKPNIIFF